MITNEKLYDILGNLLGKSRTRQVNWKEELRGADYSVEFQQSKLNLAFRSPPAEPDYILVSISRKLDGAIVKELTIEEDSPHWPLARDVYDAARQYGLGTDQILSEIENSISGGGVIGI